MISTIRQYLLYVIIFLLPWQGVFILRETVIEGEKWQYGTIGLYGADVAIIILVLLCIPKLRGIKMFLDITNISLIVLILWASVSVLWASDPVVTAYFAYKLILAGGLFLVVRYLQVNIALVLGILLLSLTLQGTLGLWQYLSQSTFSSVLLGLSEYEVWKPGVSVLKNGSGRWLRAYGSLPHPNMMGGYVAITLLVIVGSARFLAYKYTQLNRSIWKMLVFVGVFVALLGVLVSFSRTAWLALVLGFAALWWKDRKIFHLSNKNVRIVLGVFIVSVALFIGIFYENILYRFDAVTVATERSVSDRRTQLREGRDIFLQSPFLGVGGGNYTRALMEHDPAVPAWQHQPVHNIFFMAAIELGIVGGGLLMLLYGSLLWKNVQYIYTDPLRKVFIIALVALLLVASFDHWIWTHHFGVLFLAFIAGLSVRRIRSV